MKISILICARSRSKRLPLKHFCSLAPGLNALEVLCRRIQNMLPDPRVEICLITTTDEEDLVFKDRLPDGVAFFQGAPNNIPYRQWQAACARDADVVVAVDGDDILVSPEAISAVIQEYEKNPNAQGKIISSEGLPLGMNISLYSRKFLEGLVKQRAEQKLETGWGRIFPDDSKISVAVKLDTAINENLRFTLDYPEDLKFFEMVCGHFGKKITSASTEEIVHFVMGSKAYTLNEAVAAEYWENFKREKSQEENVSQ